MGLFSSRFNGVAKSFSLRKGGNSVRCERKEAVEEIAKKSKKNDSILCSSGVVNVDGSNNFASVFSKRGHKGTNQDCCIVWEEFGCQDDMMFCGIFDGHGPWGHFVAKRVRWSMPRSLLCNWQETLVAQSSSSLDDHVKEIPTTITNATRQNPAFVSASNTSFQSSNVRVQQQQPWSHQESSKQDVYSSGTNTMQQQHLYADLFS